MEFHVFTYSIFLVLGFFLSSFIVFHFGREDLKEELYIDTFVYTSFFALLGARLFYILLHFDSFGFNVISYIIVRDTPGFSVWGAVFGAVLFLWYYTRRRKINFQRILDVLCIAFSLGLSIVSLGSFIGGSSIGTATNLPIGVAVADMDGFYHPVELYQSFLFLVVFALLMWFQRVYFRKLPGIISVCFLSFFSLIIFLLEFFKAQPVYLYYKITLNHVVAFSIFSASVGYLIYILFQKIKKGKNTHG